jgi:DNA-binding beta-propeller fold protein YncE
MRHFKWLCGLCCIVGLLGCEEPETPPEPAVPEVLSTPNPNSPNHITFETVATRPMVQVGDRLFATNTRDNHIDVFSMNATGELTARSSIPVGMEPTAIAARNDHELWVVNHLSDSISIIDIAATVPYVKRTLLVGDEPRDIVFAQDKAFITTAHRGQHRTHTSIGDVAGAGDPQTHDAGVSRADVWVFDAANLGTALGGKPVKIVEMFGDTPRGLAVSPDGNLVYAAVFHSGNQTTAIHEGVMCEGFTDDQYGNHPCSVKDGITSPNGLTDGALPGGRPGPGYNIKGEPQPWTSMIVKFDRDSGVWKDTLGRNFSNGVRFHLPDKDVFAINVKTLAVTHEFAHVGTTLYNLVVNPVNGKLYVSNTDAQNHIRFEGPGEHGGSTVQGNIAQARITVIEPSSAEVKPRHLNSHIDYAVHKATASTKQHSLATPTQMAVTRNGQTLYVAALGSNRVGVFNTADLDNDQQWAQVSPTTASTGYLSVTGGPIGVHLDEARKRLFVQTHFDNAISVINLENGQEVQRVALHNPEPEAVTVGRPMLYDAQRTSSNGEASCAACHIFGDTDHLAWNLGNPDEPNTVNAQPQPTRNITELDCTVGGANSEGCQFLTKLVNGNGDLDTFASMKGPMGTQTLRGMSTHGHMHWRGDRSTGYFGTDRAKGLEAQDERLSFKNFIVANEGLLGLDISLPDSSEVSNKSADVVSLETDMDRFTDFALAIQLPPNPHVGLDRTHSISANNGRRFFNGSRRADGLAEDIASNGPERDGVNCRGCHRLDPEKGFFGTDGGVSHGGEVLMLKTPHLRNLYQRVGMFGLPDRPLFMPSTTREHQGDQIRGFGFLHDGATDRLFNFLQGAVFDNGEVGCPHGIDNTHGCENNSGRIGIPDDRERLDVANFLMEFDTDIAPIVGQQITLSASHQSADVIARIDLLEARAKAAFTSKVLGGGVTDCDLIVTGQVGGQARNYLFSPAEALFQADVKGGAPLSMIELRNLATTGNNALTFTCVPPGSGHRMALDRDLDGKFNRDP